jgi:hypothetical protein
MAKIHEEVVIIKLSKLVREGEDSSSLASDEILTAIEQVAQELVGDSVIVEAEKA